MPSFGHGARKAASGLLPSAGAAKPLVSAVTFLVPRPLDGKDFAAILKVATRGRSAHFSLHWRPSQADRLGLVVSRKLAGSSVRRNLVKRHARELFRFQAAGSGVGSRGLDVVLRVVKDLRGLDRQAELLEMRGLFSALPSGARPERS